MKGSNCPKGIIVVGEKVLVGDNLHVVAVSILFFLLDSRQRQRSLY